MHATSLPQGVLVSLGSQAWSWEQQLVSMHVSHAARSSQTSPPHALPPPLPLPPAPAPVPPPAPWSEPPVPDVVGLVDPVVAVVEELAFDDEFPVGKPLL